MGQMFFQNLFPLLKLNLNRNLKTVRRKIYFKMRGFASHESQTENHRVRVKNTEVRYGKRMV